MTAKGPLTAKDWLSCRQPEKMLAQVLPRMDVPRAYRVMLVWCRRVAPLFPNRHVAEAVRLLEDCAAAHGEVSWSRKEASYTALLGLQPRWPDSLAEPAQQALAALVSAVSPLNGTTSAILNVLHSAQAALLADGGQHLDRLPPRGKNAWHRSLKESFGRPLADVAGDLAFPVRFDPAWRTPLVVRMAADSRERRDYGDLPILADALADEGCEEDHLLAHLRRFAQHSESCWALRLILDEGSVTPS